jgi:hypothetical protein
MTVAIPRMPQPSGDELKRLRDWVGVPLPTSYVDFVKLHDGAKPASNLVMTANNEVNIRRFIPVREAVEEARAADGFPYKVIPLAEDGSGNYFYVEPISGAVCFWDHEVEETGERLAESAFALAEQLQPLSLLK